MIIESPSVLIHPSVIGHDAPVDPELAVIISTSGQDILVDDKDAIATAGILDLAVPDEVIEELLYRLQVPLLLGRLVGEEAKDGCGVGVRISHDIARERRDVEGYVGLHCRHGHERADHTDV